MPSPGKSIRDNAEEWLHLLRSFFDHIALLLVVTPIFIFIRFNCLSSLLRLFDKGDHWLARVQNPSPWEFGIVVMVIVAGVFEAPIRRGNRDRLKEKIELAKLIGDQIKVLDPDEKMKNARTWEVDYFNEWRAEFIKASATHITTLHELEKRVLEL